MSASGNLVNGDWYAYSEVGQQILDGGKLYSDAWQDKPPLGLLFYVVPQFFARGSPQAVYVFFVVWLALEIAAIWLLTRDVHNFWGKWAASFLLCLLPLTDRDFIWPGTVHSSNLFVLICVLIAYRFVRRRTTGMASCVAAGVSIVFAFHCRQSSLPLAAVPLLAALIVGPTTRSRVRAIVGFGGGTLLGFTVVLALIAWIGDFAGYWDVTFRYPSRYAQYSEMRCAYPGESLAHVGWLLTSPPGAIVLTSIFFAMVILLCVDDGPQRKVTWLPIVCSALSMLAILAPMKPYVHYFSASFPVLAMMPIVYLADRTSGTYRLKKCLTFGLLVFVAVRAAGASAILAVAPEVDSPSNVMPCTMASLREAGRYVDEHALPGDNLFVYADWVSEPALYFVTRAPSAHKYFWTMQLNPYWVNAIPDSDEIAGYALHPPVWIATLTEIPSNDREHLPAGRELTEHYLNTYSYKKMTQIDKWLIYRRSDSASTLSTTP